MNALQRIGQLIQRSRGLSANLPTSPTFDDIATAGAGCGITATRAGQHIALRRNGDGLGTVVATPMAAIDWIKEHRQ